MAFANSARHASPGFSPHLKMLRSTGAAWLPSPSERWSTLTATAGCESPDQESLRHRVAHLRATLCRREQAFWEPDAFSVTTGHL